jgi:hypothetical protein
MPVQDVWSEESPISVWLRSRIGRSEYAQHVAETPLGDVMLLYFRRLEDALALTTVFPELELADATTAQAHTPAHTPVPVPKRLAGRTGRCQRDKGEVLNM